jgi:hypothetical protein
LRNYFPSGEVDACTIVWDADGKLRGFAFLTFEDPGSVNDSSIKDRDRKRVIDGSKSRGGSKVMELWSCL